MFEVILNDVIIYIHIGMIGTAAIFNGILNKLKAGYTHSIKRQVIGAAGIAYRYCAGIQFPERFKPLRKDGSASLISLQVNTPYFTCSVIEIKVG